MRILLLIIEFVLCNEFSFRIRYKQKRGMDQDLLELIALFVVFLAFIITIFS